MNSTHQFRFILRFLCVKDNIVHYSSKTHLYVFEESLSSLKLHLFGQKYSNIVKYYYKLK